MAVSELSGLDYRVIKSHRVLDVSGSALLKQGAPVIHTYRDPGEAIASLMAFNASTFEDALVSVTTSLEFLSWLIDEATVLPLPFAEIVRDLANATQRIAGHLGVAADHELIAAVAAETNLAAAQRVMATIDSRADGEVCRDGSYVYDRATLIHRNHVTNAGREWRSSLKPSELQRVEELRQTWASRLGLRF